MAELRHPRVVREGCQSRLLFKKRMFRETDESIAEAQFINLSYVQAQHDYLAGNYPVVREDAAQVGGWDGCREKQWLLVLTPWAVALFLQKSGVSPARLCGCFGGAVPGPSLP